MSLVLYARNDHPGILIVCPHCKIGVRHDVDTIGDAIREGKQVECAICGASFKVYVEVAEPQPITNL
jgi:transcription elongation factor Elf1